jgi:putative ABC transport system permease protein
MKFLVLVLKNVARNPLRAVLTALGTMVLVFVVTLVWSVLAFLDEMTQERSQDLKAVVTERWQVPSTMPFTYARTLSEGAARRPGDVKPLDAMAWQFYGGTIDPGKLTRDSIVFAVAMEPRKVRTMMDELDRLPEPQARELDAAVRRLEQKRNGLILGCDRLAAIKKRVGERIKIYSLNYKEIDLEFEIVGMFPSGRYDGSAVMNSEYLNEALDAYARLPGKGRHPMADQSLNVMWLRMRDRQHFERVAEQIASAPYYSNPAVKCETAASGIASFLEAFRDLIWGMRWLLAPAALVTLSLVIANAISISVRERRTELAVLKVLGFRPWQLLAMVIAEALLLGTLSGLVSAGLTYVAINHWLGGLKFPIAMFGSFYIDPAAVGWGASIGALTALAGSLVPAWTARNVQVAEVFAKVT